MMLKGWWGMSEERAIYTVEQENEWKALMREQQTKAIRASVSRCKRRVRKLAVDGIGAAAGVVCAFALLRVWQGGAVMELIGAALVCFCLCVAAVLLRAGE
jgi:hypothetical protein